MQKKYCISYDLNRPGQDYSDLIKAIKSYEFVEVMKSGWFVKSTNSAQQIYDHLRRYIDDNDFLFISEITSNMSGWLKKNVVEWLSQ
jgi:hypothetical protein